MIRLPNAKNSGVANISSMIVPCMVNSWLYCSGDRNCRPGRASSPRISMAIRPPMRKNANEVVRYIRPMVLWSVVRSRFDSREPFTATWAGLGRLTMGAGAIVVTGRELRRCSASTSARQGGAPVTGRLSCGDPGWFPLSGLRTVGADVDSKGYRHGLRKGAGGHLHRLAVQMPGVRPHAHEGRHGAR